MRSLNNDLRAKHRAIAFPTLLAGALTLLLSVGCSSEPITDPIAKVEPKSNAASSPSDAPAPYSKPPLIAPKVAANPVQQSLPPGDPRIPQPRPTDEPRQIEDLSPQEAVLKEEVTRLNGLFRKTEVTQRTRSFIASEGGPQIDDALVEVFLDRTPVTDDMLSAMPGLETATYLSLFRTQITDEGLRTLGRCQSLIYLDLSHTAVTDQGLQHLKSLPNLTRVVVAGTGVTDAAIAELKEQLPRAFITRNYDPRK